MHASNIGTIEDEKQSAILCMSMSVPLSKQKLAPLLATGHFDGRLVLRDMQTGTTLLNAVSSIVHPGPVRVCMVMEGIKRPLAIAASDDAAGRAALYVYNFEMGSLACAPIQDHVEQITALASVSVPLMHSLFITASMDGYIHIYDMHSCNRMLTLSPEQNTRGPVFALDVIPGSLTGNRPSLLLAGGMDGVIRIFNLGMGKLSHHHAAGDVYSGLQAGSPASASKDYDIPVAGRSSRARGSYTSDSIETTNPNASKRQQQTYATSLRGHRGKLFAVAGLATATLGCVSGGEDTCIRVWNVETGQQLLCVSGQHTEEIRSIRITMTPRPIIVSSGYDSRIVVLDLSISKNGEHRRAIKALQTRRLGAGAQPQAGVPEDGTRTGRRTLVQANMESAVGMLDKRTSIIGPSRRGFGNVAPAPSPSSVAPTKASLHLPGIATEAPISSRAEKVAEEAGDREEVRVSTAQASMKPQRERKITVISMSKLATQGDKNVSTILEEEDEEGDENSDTDESQRGPDSLVSGHVEESAQKVSSSFPAIKKR